MRAKKSSKKPPAGDAPPGKATTWKLALGIGSELVELDMDAKQLPAVKWPKAKHLPPEMGQLTNLRRLSIRATNLGWLCPEMAALTQLESLSIVNADRSLEIGSVLARLPALTSIELYNVGLSGFVPLPDSMERVSLHSNDHLDLEAWIDGLQSLPKLRSLNLAAACKNGLPDRFATLSRLRELDLASNELEVIPDAVFALSQLEALHVGANRIAVMSDGFKRLKHLSKLWIGHNPLQGLPEWLPEMSALRELDLSTVPLQRVPSGLGKMQLEQLWLDAPVDVVAELRQSMPGCKITSATKADHERRVARAVRMYSGTG